ncbi:hypothetical protein E2C01_084620 [Portunus trituberculatus]|uniref:Uncharacterized protein n=1 Tax=Portunus trituberculatus TaxID=210409 RepID=A0A5B7J6S0_PORTR|nr:hypothetical protein [Portunus trituberculatus]
MRGMMRDFGIKRDALNAACSAYFFDAKLGEYMELNTLNVPVPLRYSIATHRDRGGKERAGKARRRTGIG